MNTQGGADGCLVHSIMVNVQIRYVTGQSIENNKYPFFLLFQGGVFKRRGRKARKKETQRLINASLCLNRHCPPGSSPPTFLNWFRDPGTSVTQHTRIAKNAKHPLDTDGQRTHRSSFGPRRVFGATTGIFVNNESGDTWI